VDASESRLLRRVAQTVEAGEVPADLLTELRSRMEWARKLPQEKGHALAVQDIAERLGLPLDHAEAMLAALEAQPTVARELVLRRVVEVWLAEQRRAYGAQGTSRGPDGDR
jgi:hypothetical protein